MRRLSPRSACRTSTGAPRRSVSASDERLGIAHARLHDHLRRHRDRARVVLEGELLRHLALLTLRGVLEVEALPVGQHAVADLEYLRVRVRALRRHGDRVEGAHGCVGDALPLEQRPHRLQLVPVLGCLLELLLRGRLAHPLVERLLDVAVAPGEEVDDRLDVLAIRLLRDVADAGGLAALDVVVEAGAARGASGLRAVAGAVHEDLAEQVERLADALGVAEGAEVDAILPVPLAREVNPWKILVEADPDVRVGLVVTQPDVEDGPVALDELLLGEQRLGLGLGRDELDVRDLGDHVRGPARAGL